MIMATHKGETPRTTAEIVIRAADLSSLSKPYEEYTEASNRIYAEAALRRGTPQSKLEWFVGVCGHLCGYLAPLLEVTPHARLASGASDWHTNVLANLARTWRELTPGGLIIGEVLSSKHSWPEMKGVPTNCMYIAFSPDEAHRLSVVARLEETVAPVTASLVVPGSPDAISAPDQLFDILIAPRSGATSEQEFKRVLKSAGELRWRE